MLPSIATYATQGLISLQLIEDKSESVENLTHDAGGTGQKGQNPQSHVSRLERGKHVPSHATIDRIAKALRIHPSKLDPGREAPEPIEGDEL
jgi:transcriptional regulator with XRE-family HTH domain